MHLGAAPLGLEPAVREVLDRRLRRNTSRLVAVALSGGGDSLALLLAAAAWANGAGRRLVVLTVDHQLRPESAAWTQACAKTAERLGLPFRALVWIGEKPKTGLPAAARGARHRLLADAAREAGARVILMGHTADDVLEARVMRDEGSTTPEPRSWGPSPVWPQGRGIFLLRPLLSIRRSDIRAWLAARGEHWIDDPANEDATYARPRARQAIAQGAAFTATVAVPSTTSVAFSCRARSDGGFEIARSVLRTAAPEGIARFVAAACLCAAGASRPPSRARVARLSTRLIETEAFVASLAGARIEADPVEVRFLREAGEAARGGLAPIGLGAGETGVWDGRFEITAARDVEVRATSGSTTPDPALNPRSLTWDRLLAACGAVEQEPI